MDKRPNLDKEISLKDFQEFYWLKEELVKFCRLEGIKTTGGKIELGKRIENYLKTGQKEFKQPYNNARPSSKFDWRNTKLSPETLITDNYKSTENVRAFFKSQIGNHFKFNVQFMNWIQSHSGRTLKDAIDEWVRIKSSKKDITKEKEIAPQFEYNRYLKDFLADNPNQSRALGIKLWKIKKSLRGNNKYKKEDLNLIPKKQK